MSVISEADRKSIMEWGIVMIVIKSDEANAEIIIILLLRERLNFFQNCSGTTMRERSATTSAAGTKELEDHDRRRKQKEVLTSHLQDCYRLGHLAREDARFDLLY